MQVQLALSGWFGCCWSSLRSPFDLTASPNCTLWLTRLTQVQPTRAFRPIGSRNNQGWELSLLFRLGCRSNLHAYSSWLQVQPRPLFDLAVRSSLHAPTLSPAYDRCRSGLHALTVSPAYKFDCCWSGLLASTVSPAYTLDCCRFCLHASSLQVQSTHSILGLFSYIDALASPTYAHDCSDRLLSCSSRFSRFTNPIALLRLLLLFCCRSDLHARLFRSHQYDRPRSCCCSTTGPAYDLIAMSTWLLRSFGLLVVRVWPSSRFECSLLHRFNQYGSI